MFPETDSGVFVSRMLAEFTATAAAEPPAIVVVPELVTARLPALLSPPLSVTLPAELRVIVPVAETLPVTVMVPAVSVGADPETLPILTVEAEFEPVVTMADVEARLPREIGVLVVSRVPLTAVVLAVSPAVKVMVSPEPFPRESSEV
jgi:hypothetical protein